jgi:hypothetical protein
MTEKRHLVLKNIVNHLLLLKRVAGSSVSNIPSKSRSLADENKKLLKEWK